MNLQPIIAGDTLNFTTAVPNYPANAGWALVYQLVPRAAGGAPITLSSTPDAADAALHRLQAGASVTAGWAPGVYSWVAQASKTGERYTLATGSVDIKPDPATATSLDTRSSARKALEAMDALLETYGSKAYMQGYEISGRRMQFHSPGEFLAFRSKLQAEVKREENVARIAAGLSPRNQVAVRISR